MNSLRVKVEFVLFLTIGLVVALSFGIQRNGVLPSLNPLEEEFLKDMGRVIEVLRDRQAELTGLGADLAADSELSSFLRGENEEYGVANFSREALIRQRLNLLYLLDADGQVLSGCYRSQYRRSTEYPPIPNRRVGRFQSVYQFQRLPRTRCRRAATQSGAGGIGFLSPDLRR
jgi:hypothetical protein